MTSHSPLQKNKRVILITGATGGLGRAFVRALSGESVHFIAFGRSVAKLEGLDDEVKALGGSATLVPIDFSDDLMKGAARLNNLLPTLIQKFDRIDGVIFCAAHLGALTPVTLSSPDLWEMAFGVNCLAPWHILRSIDPLLRHSTAGRVLFVSCAQVTQTLAYWGPYVASKTAFEAMARCYQAETAEITNIQSQIWRAPAMRTMLRATAFPGESSTLLPLPETLIDGWADWLLARASVPK